MTLPAKIHALNSRQYQTFKRMARDSKDVVREPVEVEPSNRSRLPVARLMTVGTDMPIYNPLETRKCVLFQLDRLSLQATVRFIGENLWGDVWLTVGDMTVRIDCRATTDVLRARLSGLRDCRVTAFPALWEFAFGTETRQLPTITCEPVITSNSIRFLGGCVVTQEGWRSATADGETASQVDVIDCIPYLEGEVKLGAMAVATRYGDTTYLAGQWSCPRATFRSV